jgi:cysteine desulfuration protein SufE
MLRHTLENLIENFSLLDDWEARYQYLIDLGRDVPAMAEDLKIDDTLVRGCTSRVWMVADKGADGRYHLLADSDAHIVRGLVAVLLAAYQDKTAAEMAAVDIEGAFARMGLSDNLSPNRRNGFFAMVERIRAFSS